MAALEKLELVSDIARSPTELDQRLRFEAIRLHKSGLSWRQMARDVEASVKARFSDSYQLVSEGKLTTSQLDKAMKPHIPSHTYIQEFCKGRAVCYRYTNTLANFLGVNYTLSNFDPCEEYAKTIKV